VYFVVTFRSAPSDGCLNFTVLLQDALLIFGDRKVKRPLELPSYFFACFLTFAQRFFAALTIAARPAAERTRFFATDISFCAE
jgi:hypothetical protein